MNTPRVKMPESDRRNIRREYQMCVRCVMDTSDPEITFDAAGECSHCQNYDRKVAARRQTAERATQTLDAIVVEIKRRMRRKEYDCVLGLSGGVDSSYLAYVLVRNLGLRVLAIHVDAGWNSELAVKNIENIVRTLGIDLDTHVVDWAEMRDLQLAFIRAGVPNLDIPQDHAFFSALYQTAARHNIPYVMSGGNMATESVLPSAWGYNWSDRRHLLAVHRQYGTRKLKTFPTMGFLKYYLYYPFIRRLQVYRPLDYVPYNKEEAIKTLEHEVGYRYYDTKHGESRFTRYFQNFYLPSRFGFDKRRAHLSSVILSGQADRDSAIKELKSPPFQSGEFAEETLFVAKKLGIEVSELEECLKSPLRYHEEFPTNAWLFELKNTLKRGLERKGIRIHRS